MEQSADYWRGAGERIETLLQANAGAGPVARDRAEQLVREVVQLYGAALERTVALADPATMDAMVRDDLVSSLLLVHGLHPHDVETRVRTALDSVRPYLGSHGGDVELIEVADGVVRLRLLGSCNSCPSSSVTLETAVQDAVQAAAPETTGIDVETPDSHELKSGVISVESLFSHVHAEGGGTHWVEVPEFAEVEVGEVAGFRVSGTDLLVCRSGDDLYAYRDHCPVCEHSMAGAVLERMMGRPARDAAVLTCPTCSAHFSVYGAGARVGTGSEQLAPVPVLIRDGVLSVALADDSVIPVT
ncbi:hypothetical protein C1M55_13425 [Rhodococcus qingshengii]|uniref:NifU family protein n=1 Tax=Rhodococcus TaxID=1827 RepID=UPI000975CC44|nr:MULTISPECIES: NifU family protein [Rhodococcus]AUS32003.1 hypothetical protein C1M55_13425 [Rhodococcus qingshengii]MCC4306545.1 NifU family protein [Rhodococcus sp. 3-2]OMQ36467.1 hypothetical protein BK799_07495 [Rhodococcus sp. D-1]